MLDFSRSAIANFWKMENEAYYCLSGPDWEAYQQARIARTWPRDEQSRIDLSFVRSNGLLYQYFHGHLLIWDFNESPNPTSYDLLMGSYAVLMIALAAGRLVRTANPDAIPINHVPDQFREILNFDDNSLGFWFERDHLRIAGHMSGERGSLHLHGLSEEKIAHILRIIREE